MGILNFTKEQIQAIDLFKKFIKNDQQIFILKGYAGTGKTTIIKEFIKLIKEEQMYVELFAPTGKAALILNERTQHKTSTIHGGIFGKRLTKLKEGDKDEESTISYHYCLASRETPTEMTIAIVDEASMVSSKFQQSDILSFGTGVLLNDLLTYCNVKKGGKIVFVGDPAQLPPVGDNASNALSAAYFEQGGLKVVETELTEVIRQAKDSTILNNATIIREALSGERPKNPELSSQSEDFEPVYDEEIVEKYIHLSPSADFDSPVIISWTNKNTANYNRAIRSHLFPNQDINRPCVGDRIIITSNSYCHNRAIFNGEFAMIMSVSDKPEVQTAPVYDRTTFNEKNKKINVPITYRDVLLKFEDGALIETKIVESLLMSNATSLSHNEIVSAHINCKMRNNCSKFGLEDIYRTDPYINAIQAKFGYAITGHKSQGSEWDTVFIDFAGRVKPCEDALRWMYTVITRAKKKIYAANISLADIYKKIEIQKIQIIKNLPYEAFSYEHCPETPFHKNDVDPALKSQYHSIYAALKLIDHKIVSVKSFPYRERYEIETPEGKRITIDGQYNKSYRLRFNNLSEYQDIMAALNQFDDLYLHLDYHPSTPAFKELYQTIEGVCQEQEVTITNVIEHVREYHITFYLKTQTSSSYLKFFFDDEQCLTTLMPYSLEENDQQLSNILTEISNII